MAKNLVRARVAKPNASTAEAPSALVGPDRPGTENSALIKTQSDLVLFIKRDGTIVDVKAPQSLLGASSPDGFRGRSIVEIMGPSLGGRAKRAIKAAVETGRTHFLEYESDLDGRRRSFEARYVPCDDDQVLSLVREVTRRRIAEAALRESQTYLSQIAETINHVLWVVSADHTKLFYVSPSFERVWGSPVESLYREPSSWTNSIIPEDRRRVLQAIERRGLGALDEEYRIRRPDGTIRWIHDHAFPVVLAPGRDNRVVGVAEDVTDRKNASLVRDAQGKVLELLIAGKALARILDVLIELIETRTPGVSGSVLLAGDDGKRLFHCSGPKLPAEYIRAIDGVPIGPNVGSCGTAAFERRTVVVEDIASDPLWADYRDCALAHGLRSCWSAPIISLDGVVIGSLALYHAEPRRPSREDLLLMEEVARLAAMAIERSRAKEALDKGEARFRAIAELTFTGVLQLTLDRRVLFANAAVCGLFQVAGPGELMGQCVDQYFGPESAEALAREKAACERGVASVREVEIVGRQGGRRSVILESAPITNRDGAIETLIESFTDITARKRAERALQLANQFLEQRVRDRTMEVKESEERFQLLADAAFEGIAIRERDRIIATNQAFCSIFGYQRHEMIGQSCQRLFSPELGLLLARMPTVEPGVSDDQAIEGLGIRMDASTVVIEVRGRTIQQQDRIAVIMAVRDVTVLRAAQARERRHQAELAHVLRRVTMNEMASSVAHELNQPLTAIANYARGLIRRVTVAGSVDPSLAEVFEKLAEQSERAGQIIRRMRRFVQKGETQRTRTGINDIVLEVERLMRAELSDRGVTLRLDLAGALPAVIADSIQLEQVVLNLLRNGCDAVCGADSGERAVTISTSTAPNGWVEVAVSDSGVGLTPAAHRGMFEPFFTTKPRGLGMGLSISRSIIEAHGGRLWGAPNEGAGATFRFCIPAEPPETAPS